VHPRHVEQDARGTRGEIVLPSGTVELTSRLVGEHNLDNLLMALAVVEGLGLDASRAAAALAHVSAVPGRLERCDVPRDDLIVLVDYAHTPDALRRALSAVRRLTSGQVICVFGCGGDRDPDKRSKMGDVVGSHADRAIVTNDNPRSEAPETIARAIELGLSKHPLPWEIELDRSVAIERAVRDAAPGDVVLIAGKGHEPYQIIGAERRRFDDRFEARRALALRRERLEA
jgi:UDP-N-acetylmuramoyl-L-alanyl-D-glutamate--2,6-diaminopimelate ligase